MIERDPRLPAPAASALHGESGPSVAEVAEVLGLEPEVAKPADKHGRKPAWVLAMVTMGVVVGIVAIGFIKFVNGPVSAGALAATPTPSGRPAESKTGTAELGGIYFDMTYPALFDQVNSKKSDPLAVEQYYFGSKAEYSRSLAVSVRTSSSNMVEDEAAYKFRLIHPEDYKERRDKMNGQPVVLMFKNDKTEATLFWANKGKVLTVSVVSNKPTDSVEDMIGSIETKIRWKS